MPSLSSDWVRKRWRYAVREEFHRVPEDPSEPAGEAASWAPGHPHIFPRGEQGGAERYMKFENPSDEWADYSLNCDQTKLAVVFTKGRYPSQDFSLHVYDIASGHKRVLKGHSGRIDGILFSSKDPNLLISAYEPMYGDEDNHSEILLWDISAHLPEPVTIPDEDLLVASGFAVDAMSELKLSHTEQGVMRDKIHDSLSKVVANRVISGVPKLSGRISNSFGSAPFSRSGRYVIYEPGDRPRSNGRDERWILKVYDLHHQKDTITLKGHTDSIMWVGWSHTDGLIMSVCWDKTIRIWNAKTGGELFQWKTKTQNWTAEWGPPGEHGDAEWVIATSGDGIAHCWSLKNGEELWHHPYANQGGSWTRAVAVSPGGRYVVVAGERSAGVDIVDLQREKGEKGRLDAVTQRILGPGDLRAPPDDDEEALGEDDEMEELDPEERKKEAERRARAFVMFAFNARDVRFIDDYRFVWNSSVDTSLHMYDIRKNLMYRWAPEYPPAPDPKEGEEEKWEDPTGLLGFEARVEKGETVLYSVHTDGMRTWRIPPV